MPERATQTITITRSGDTVAQAENRLRKANARFVESLVPGVRTVTLQPPSDDPNAPKWIANKYDFFERDPITGAILLNNNGNERIRPNALANAVNALLNEYHRNVVTEAIRSEKKAQLEADIATEINNDLD